MARALLLCALLSASAWGLCPYAGHAGRKPKILASTADDEWMPQLPEATDSSDPMVAANLLMQRMYVATGQTMLPQLLIVQETDYLVLLKRQGNSFARVRSDPINTPLYHDLKMVAHIPLAIFIMLLPHASLGNAFPQADVLLYQQSVLNASQTVTAQRFPQPAQLQRQQAIAAAALRFLADALGAGQVSMGALQAYSQQMAPLLQENVREAARSQIDTLVTVLTTWRTAVLGELAWQGLRFVATTSHMAAHDNLVSQVFARLLSKSPQVPDMQPNDPNMRFITLDDVNLDEPTALDLMATHHTDYAVGAAFFGSPYVMHRDLLANATSDYLNELFPPPAEGVEKDAEVHA